MPPKKQAEQEEAVQPPEEQQLTPEQVKQVQDIMSRSLAEGKGPKEAMRDAREGGALELSDDDIDRVGDRLMGMFRDAGAFDPPPDPVTPPSQPETPPAPGEPKAEETPSAPTKRNFAQRFMGL